MRKEFRMEFSIAIERFYRKTLIIDQTGMCELHVESNIEHPDTPEIGQYLTQISIEEAVQLHERVLALYDVAVPEESIPLPPGVPLFEVVVYTDEHRQSRTFDPHTVPKRYQVVGRQIAEIEKAAYDKQENGLRSEFSLKNEQVDRTKPLLVEISFKAIGTIPVLFYNPISPPPNGFGRITLSGIRSDIDKANLQFFHRQAHHFTKQEIQRMDQPFSTDEPLLSLKAGSPATLTFEAVLDWPPGEYDVKIIVDTAGPTTAKRDKVIGRITTLSQRLVITGESKPADKGVQHYEPPAL